MAETQADREYDIRQQGYEGLSDDLNEALDSTLNEVTYNAQKQEEVISEMLNHVVNNYATAYDKINQIIANTGFTPSGDFQQNIDNIGNQAGAQGQIDASNTIAPNYTPDDFVGGINTGQIQSDANQSHNDFIESEIEKEPNIDNRPVALITLKPTSISVEEGKSASITANIRPTDAANKTVTWTSSNTSVATVSNGTVKGVKPGSAAITCMANDGSGTTAACTVSVTKKPDPPKQTTSSNGGDGIPRVGDRATLSGKYYYDSWGQTPAGSKYSGVPNGVVIDSYSSSKYGGNARRTGDFDVHIKSADGVYGDLGWVRLSQLSGYARGTKYVPKDQLAWTQENGPEMIVSPSTGAVLTKVTKGDSVIPANLTENLFKWGAINPQSVLPITSSSVLPGGLNTTPMVIENHYDSLLTVNGDIDKEVFPGVKKMCEEAYQYTSSQFKKNADLMGIRRSL